MLFLNINKTNLNLLENFFDTYHSNFFRYYEKRSFDYSIKNHKYTVLVKLDENIIGYGHIDYCDNKYWLGIFICDKEQNKGYGKKLIKHLIEKATELCIGEIYLSVDKDNHIAFHLYQTFNFKINETYDKYIIMKLNFDTIKLPVSYGEAFDKLSILDIKMSKIKDDRIFDVKNEYSMIKDKLNNLMTNDIIFHYRILKMINETIWDKQDIFRKETNISLKNNLCIEIIEENDRRFRVKNKINNILNSLLKEQKGYNRKKAFILTHLGLGDHITSMGIVRYYSTIYDEIYVVCIKKYEQNVRLMYKDDITIKIFPINTTNYSDVNSDFGFSKIPGSTFTYNNEKYDLITVGMYGSVNTKSYTIPFCFYKDINLDYSIFWDYSHIVDTYESKELYNKIIENHDIKNYVVIHYGSRTSMGNSFREIEKYFKINRNDTLLINIEKNMYEREHPYYELANIFVMKPVIFYKDILINASKIFVSDSCLFCLAMMLDIKTEECYILNNSVSGDYYQYIFTDQYKFNDIKTRRFKKLQV